MKPEEISVLIVEDDLLVLKFTAFVIRHLGFKNVRTAGTIKAAREVIRVVPTQLIVCDLSLPDGDGRVFLAQALKIHPAPAAILISGLPSFELKISDELRAAVCLLGKPFSVDEMRAAVREAADRQALAAGTVISP